MSKLSKELRDIHLRNKADDTDIAYLLLPITNMHLYTADGTDAGIGTVNNGRPLFFSGIAILISCLGLLGLATYTAIRTREIGIRKVLGSITYSSPGGGDQPAKMTILKAGY